MKIAGITMVRNEIDVIEFCIEHHLGQGLDYIFICDNGSTDGTLEYLREKSKNDSRVILHEDSGQFHQQRIINYLSNMAYKNNCDWVIPFDADEIWFSENTLKIDLEKVEKSSIRIKLKDFVQAKNITDPKEDTYISVNWRLPDDYEKPNLQDVVIGKKSMVESPSFYKYIIKTSESLSIAPGAHSFFGQDNDFYEGVEFNAYHVPIRSYQALVLKAEQGQRLIDAGYPPDHGWHVQRYANLYRTGYLADEWFRNSEENGIITRADGTTLQLVFDDSLSKIYQNYLDARGAGKITALIRTIGRETLANAIECAKREFDDVIVVADGIDLEFESLPKNVTYLKNTDSVDLYGGAAINLGAKNCKTQYICLLDDDDEYIVDSGNYMRETINSDPTVDVWIPGLRYNDGHIVCMNDGLYGGNVAVPTYKTKVLQLNPFVPDMGPEQGLTDFYHVDRIFNNGHKVGWYKKHLYDVRPHLSGRHGNGIK